MIPKFSTKIQHFLYAEKKTFKYKVRHVNKIKHLPIPFEFQQNRVIIRESIGADLTLPFRPTRTYLNANIKQFKNAQRA